MLFLQQPTHETVLIFAPKYVSEENAALIFRTGPRDRPVTLLASITFSDNESLPTQFLYNCVRVPGILLDCCNLEVGTDSLSRNVV